MNKIQRSVVILEALNAGIELLVGLISISTEVLHATGILERNDSVELMGELINLQQKIRQNKGDSKVLDQGNDPYNYIDLEKYKSVANTNDLKANPAISRLASALPPAATALNSAPTRGLGLSLEEMAKLHQEQNTR